VIRTGERLKAIVDALLLNMQVSGQENPEFVAVEGKAFPTYLLGNELYLSIPDENLFVGSKSFDQIEKAMAVIKGEASSIAKGDSKLVRSETEGFFLFASANGLNEIDGIPPQARMLQQATGAQFSLGEMNGDLRSRLLLTTESAAVSNQLYRIIQGMLALVSFAKVENESLEQVVRNTKVLEGNDFVSVDLSYSAENIMMMLRPLIEKGVKPTGSLGGSSNGRKRENTEKLLVDDPIGGEQLKVLNVDARSDNGNFARRAVDGLSDTWWASRGRGQWIRFELDSPSLVREIQISWGRGDQRQHRFTVQSSTDGMKWERVIDRISSGTTTDFESYNIPDAGSKWIRLVCNSNTKDPMNVIREIKFIGESNYEIPVEGAVE